MAVSFAFRAVVSVCALLTGTGIHAQSYPVKPIRFLVGFPPGGTNDIVARLLAQKLSETMGQSPVVENRGGANTAIATELLARAAPDGYTILLNAAGHATNPSLIAGQTSIMFPNMPGVIGHARSGKLRALAVTGARRSDAAPDIATVAESGVPGFEVTAWFGVSAPARTPRTIIDRLNGEMVRALKSPDLREKLLTAGAEPVGTTPEEYTAFVQNEIAKWGKVIRAAGLHRD